MVMVDRIVSKEETIEYLKNKQSYTVVDMRMNYNLICLIDLGLSEALERNGVIYGFRATQKSLRLSRKVKDKMILTWMDENQFTLNDFKGGDTIKRKRSGI